MQEYLSGVVPAWWLDQFGHMNARWYAHILDDTSFQFWARNGIPQRHLVETYGVQTVTASVTTDFLHELEAGDCYAVRGGVSRIGTKSVTCAFQLVSLPSGKVHARFSTVEVFADATTHSSTEIPASIREKLILLSP